MSEEEFKKKLEKTVEESYQAGYLAALRHVQTAFNKSIESLRQIFNEKTQPK